MKSCLLSGSISLLAVCLGCTKEPGYQEKTLSQWKAELQDKDSGVRTAAATALRNMGPKAKVAIPALTELLRDKDSGVRQAAARTLGNMGPEAKSAVVALTKALQDDDGKVQGRRRGPGEDPEAGEVNYEVGRGAAHRSDSLLRSAASTAADDLAGTSMEPDHHENQHCYPALCLWTRRHSGSPTRSDYFLRGE